MKELKEMGVKAVGELQALNRLSDVELEQYADLYREKFERAKFHTDEQMEPMMQEIDEKLIALREDTSSRLDDVNVEWQAKIRQIVQGTDKEFDSLRQVGIDAIQGLSNGMESMRGHLLSKARSIADQVKRVMQSAFDINSPSRWMRNFIGRNMIFGWMDGIDSLKTQLINKTNEMIEWMSPIVPSVDVLSGLDNVNSRTAVDSTRNMNGLSGITQNITINSPQPTSPSENARKMKQASQQLALEWGG